MNLGSFVSTMVAVSIAACGSSKNERGGSGSAAATGGTTTATKSGGAETWLKAAWKPTEVEVGDVKVKVDVPEGLPANDEYMLGKDWWVGAAADAKLSFPSGPRLTLDKPKTATFDAETLARYVEPDAKRSDLIEIAKEALPDGRVRYVSATSSASHIDVTVWIPLADPARGIKCNAHWWMGSGDPLPDAKPDPAIVEWLGKFCASVQIVAAPAAPPAQ